MTTHTPGPWTAYKRKPEDMGPRDMAFHVGNAGIQHTVAEAHEEGNARLIAAAPDLLAVLRLAHSYFASHSTGENEASELFKIAGSAIAKAEGR